MNSFLKKYQRWVLAMAFGIGFFVFVLLHPGAVQADTAQAAPSLLSNLTPVCMQCGNCTLEDALLVGKNAFTLALGVVGALVLLLLVYGGFMLLISHGNQQAITYGKGIIGNTLKGLAIFLLSWTIVNAIITGLAENINITSWFSFDTPNYNFPCEKPKQEPGSVPNTTTTPGVPNPAGALGTSGWTTQNLDPGQLDDASPNLQKLVNCLYSMPELKNMVINSISDDHIFTNKCKVESCSRTASESNTCGSSTACYSKTACQHKCGSCHYFQGQSNSENGFSYAVDINKATPVSVLQKVADPTITTPGKCAKYVTLFHPEGDHLHLSAVGCPD